MGVKVLGQSFSTVNCSLETWYSSHCHNHSPVSLHPHLQFYQQWYSAFLYYAALGSGDPYHMPLNAYTTFLDECTISDNESQFIKRSDCDTIFIVCNYQPDKKSPEAQVNLENAMMRYEFLECIVRCALAKYGKGQATDDVAVAVKMLLEKNLSPSLPAGALVVSNNFRTERLYAEEVDLLLKRHQVGGAGAAELALGLAVQSCSGVCNLCMHPCSLCMACLVLLPS